jgi:hypothetical protein
LNIIKNTPKKNLKSNNGINMANEDNLKSWKPGQSGNLNGRPKGHKSIKNIIERYLTVGSKIKNEDTGEELTNQEVIVLELLKKAKKGDINAFKELVDRTEGKPTQTSVVDQTNRFPEGVEIELVKPRKKKDK